MPFHDIEIARFIGTTDRSGTRGPSSRCVQGGENQDWRRAIQEDSETCMPPLDAEYGTDPIFSLPVHHSDRISQGKNQTKSEVVLPLSLLDRLVESRIVSREAKIKSIESWQRELSECPPNNPPALELMRRLALAKSALLGQPRHGANEGPVGLTARIRRWWFTNRTDYSSAPRPLF